MAASADGKYFLAARKKAVTANDSKTTINVVVAPGHDQGPLLIPACMWNHQTNSVMRFDISSRVHSIFRLCTWVWRSHIVRNILWRAGSNKRIRTLMRHTTDDCFQPRVQWDPSGLFSFCNSSGDHDVDVHCRRPGEFQALRKPCNSYQVRLSSPVLLVIPSRVMRKALVS